MEFKNIIRLDNALSKVISCIPPLWGDWDGVFLSDLEMIHTFLSENFGRFEELIQEMLEKSDAISIHVQNIYFSLLTYRRWCYLCDSDIKLASKSNDEYLQRKAELADEVYIDVEVFWLPYLSIVYPQLDQQTYAQENIITVEGLHKMNKQEAKSISDKIELYSFFEGAPNEQELHIRILQGLFDGKQGLIVATYELAAEQLGWINRPITWTLLQKYFGVKGAYSGIGNHYNSNKKNGIDPIKVKAAKKELLSLSHN